MSSSCNDYDLEIVYNHILYNKIIPFKSSKKSILSNRYNIK